MLEFPTEFLTAKVNDEEQRGEVKVSNNDVIEIICGPSNSIPKINANITYNKEEINFNNKTTSGLSILTVSLNVTDTSITCTLTGPDNQQVNYTLNITAIGKTLQDLILLRIFSYISCLEEILLKHSRSCLKYHPCVKVV